MDPSRMLAITACGRCGQSEDAHKGRAEDAESLAVLGALGGACTQFVASDAAVIVQKHFAITNNRAPKRRPDGSIGKRLPLHECGNRHQLGSCPLGVSGPGPDTARRGAAKAREALGLTGPDTAEAS